MKTPEIKVERVPETGHTHTGVEVWTPFKQNFIGNRKWHKNPYPPEKKWDINMVT